MSHLRNALKNTNGKNPNSLPAIQRPATIQGEFVKLKNEVYQTINDLTKQVNILTTRLKEIEGSEKQESPKKSEPVKKKEEKKEEEKKEE